MYVVCYLDYLIIQYLSEVSFWFHSGLYHFFLIISILTWNNQWIGVSAYLFYEWYIFCAFIWAKHTIIFLLKVIMFLYISRINIVRSKFFRLCLSLWSGMIRYRPISNEDLISMPVTFHWYGAHIHRNAYFSISVANQYKDSKCRLTLNCI